MSALSVAKNLISFEKELIGKIESAAAPAEEELFAIIGNKEFCRYKNYKDIEVYKIESNGDNKINLYYNGICNSKILDVIEISGSNDYNGFYEVNQINTLNKYITIEAQFINNGICKILDRKIKRYELANAWLICYYSTFTIQELKKNDVLVNAEQFGEGDIKTFQQTQIKVLREDYLRNAQLLIGKNIVRDK